MTFASTRLRICFARPRRHPGRSAWVVALLVLSALAGCAPGGSLPVLAPADPGVYRLGIDDQVRVITVGVEQLTNRFRVGANGNLAMPLLGNMPAAGLTPDDLAREIAAELKSRQLLRSPSVSVEVTDYRPVFVLGEVVRPGQYPYQPGMTMLTVVTVAGGFTYRAIQGYAYVVRQEGDHTMQGRLLPGSFIEPGDVVKVYERLF